eukprot:3029184-Rhodomonas_salina.2
MSARQVDSQGLLSSSRAARGALQVQGPCPTSRLVPSASCSGRLALAGTGPHGAAAEWIGTPADPQYV